MNNNYDDDENHDDFNHRYEFEETAAPVETVLEIFVGLSAITILTILVPVINHYAITMMKF